MRRSLEPRLVGRTVVSATLHRRDIAVVPGDPAGGFSRQRGRTPRPKRVTRQAMLVGAVLGAPERRGKQLALVTEGGPAIVVHLGMTGRVLWRGKGERVSPGAHVHATWRLDDGSRLVFQDPRRFGGLWLLPDAEALRARWAVLGPDGADAPIEDVANALSRVGTARPIKAVLLDQTVIAGVGNIYADEALFRSGVHPERTAGGLDAEAVDRVARAVRTVLLEAIEARGSTLRDYTDGDGLPGTAQTLHRVYGRAGEPCVRCGAALIGTVVAQRATVFCPVCQPPPGGSAVR